MTLKSNDPIYPISVASKILDIHPRTLRIYEKEGLITPARHGQKRYFSNDDIEWVQCLRHLIHEEGISIPGIKRLLSYSPCWALKACPEEKRESCSAFVDRTLPCWERAGTACAKELSQCESCEVYIKALKEVHDRVDKNTTEKKGKRANATS